MRIARVRVSFAFLREALHLPPDTEIRFCGSDDYDCACLTVSHPDLADVSLLEGELPPVVTPTFRRQEPVVFEGWNQK